MTRSRRPWERERAQSGTRRQRLEAALVAERIALWEDVADNLMEFYDSAWFLPLAERIRVISEALGYPTDVDSVPAPALVAYEAVETMPELGIYARSWDRRELTSEPITISSEMRAALSSQTFQGDPDDD